MGDSFCDFYRCTSCIYCCWTTPGLDTNRKGCLIVNEDAMTTREGVFAGGDAVTGAATVILAMGAGKKGAAAIHEFCQK